MNKTKSLLYKYKDETTREIQGKIDLSLGSISSNLKSIKTPKIKVDNAVIFAAGKGTRLMPLTARTPKPLVKIFEKSIIETTIDNLIKNDIKDVYIAVGYHWEKFQEIVDKYKSKAKITLVKNEHYDLNNNVYSLQPIAKYLKNTLLIEGDIFWNEDVLSKWYDSPTMYGYESEDSTSEWVFIENKGKIISTKKGSINKALCWAGTYFITEEYSSKVRDFFNNRFNNFEHSQLFAEQIFWEIGLSFDLIKVNRKVLNEIDTLNDYLKVANMSTVHFDDPRQAASYFLSVSEIDIENINPIKGGLTNNVYSFEWAGKKYVLRLPKEETNKNLDRFNEYEIIETIKSEKFSPKKVVFNAETGVTIFEFIHYDKYINKGDFQAIMELGKTLKKLHTIKSKSIKLTNIRQMLVASEQQRAINKHKKHPLLVSLEDTIENIIEKYYFDQSDFVLCHNDLLQSNILFEKGKAILIDWEYGALNHPYFDLASLISENNFSEDDTNALEKTYGKIDKFVLHDFLILLNYWWAIWTYQHKEWTPEYVRYFEHKINYLKALRGNDD